MREAVGMLIEHRGEDLSAPIAIQIDEGIGRPSLYLNQGLILIFLLSDNGLPLAGGLLAVLSDYLNTRNRLIDHKERGQFSLLESHGRRLRYIRADLWRPVVIRFFL